MMLDQTEIKKIKTLLGQVSRIRVISHRSPDGDTFGSAFGLYHALRAMGKDVTVTCVDPAPDVFAFLPGIETLQVGEGHLNYDAIFIVDVGAPNQTGLDTVYPELFQKNLEVVNIDHHQSNDGFGKYNVVVPDAPSATMVTYELLQALGIPIDRTVATCLLTGIYTDTGSFMHSNTTPEALRIAARLVAKGADVRSISKDIFNTTKISTMRLWGRVLRNTYQTSDGVTMSVLTQKDFEETGADYSEVSGVVDYVNSVPGAKYSVILTERGGKVKGSLRTLRDEVNVADIAATYGGGGHIKAAGFTIPGKLEKEIRWKVVSN